jgi:hypothetical protein
MPCRVHVQLHAGRIAGLASVRSADPSSCKARARSVP